MCPFSLSASLPSLCRSGKNFVSIALCNVAAASYCHTQALSASADDGAATAAMAGAPYQATVQAWSGGAQGRGGSGGLRAKSDESDLSSRRQSRESDKSNVGQGRGNENGLSAADGPSSGGADGGRGGDCFWLMMTGILPDIINGCLATATADVKSNLIKAMNNLMVSEERRAALVQGNEISSLFELVHGYTPEVHINMTLLRATM